MDARPGGQRMYWMWVCVEASLKASEGRTENQDGTPLQQISSPDVRT